MSIVASEVIDMETYTWRYALEEESSSSDMSDDVEVIADGSVDEEITPSLLVAVVPLGPEISYM